MRIESSVGAGYRVRRSARARRARLTVTDLGEAVVVLPARASERVARELYEAHHSWVDRHQRRIRERQRALDSRPALERGRAVPIAGVPHRLVVTTALHGARSTVRLDQGSVVVVERAPPEKRTTAQLLEAWLRDLAREMIGERLGRRALEMDLDVVRLRIGDQRTRWGSASRRGTVSFNWRLVMAPPQVLDYVVVHELAHLQVAGHGQTFWQMVGRHFADSAGARRWLRDHHDELRHALD